MGVQALTVAMLGDSKKAIFLRYFVFSQPAKDPSIMAGDYQPEQYHRDVVRLRIVRAQQLQQIKVCVILFFFELNRLRRHFGFRRHRIVGNQNCLVVISWLSHSSQ